MPRRRRRARHDWAALSQRELMKLRLCDLGLEIEGTWLEKPIAKVKGELFARGLVLRPHFWLSDEWFSPSGVPGVAIPFYLAHPRLVRLERDQMLEAEGANPDDCIKLLRHEIGHAMQHGYNLSRRRAWQEKFGKASKRYPVAYRPNPASRRYVQHLDGWYAQAHPEEDFAETFAVWLWPRSNWRAQYRGWPALKKLEYVDELMGDLAGEPPLVKSSAKPSNLPSMRVTLGDYYERKRAHYSVGFSDEYDADLRKLFPARNGSKAESAASFLRRHRREIRELVAKWTGDYKFTIDQVLRDMIGRCKELRLVVDGDERRLVMDFVILLTVKSISYVYRNRDVRAV
jgi:hypothetical protein